MKKMFVFMVLGLIVFSAQKGRSAGCYVTPNNDYICDQKNPGPSGQTVQRDKKKDVGGSDYVFKAGNIRSQYDWMAGVLANMGFNLSPSPPGTTSVGTISGGSGGSASGAGTADWSGSECKPGEDPRLAAQKAIIGHESIRTKSYYDALGGKSHCSWSWIPHRGTKYCSPGGSNSGGCLTIGVGHLVTQSEMSKWSPCGTPICPGDAAAQTACAHDLFANKDFPRYWNPAVKTAHKMCLSDDEAACFLVALTAINFQLGPAWVTGRKGYTGHAGDPMLAGQFKQAATQFEGSSYCKTKAYRARCMTLVSALNGLADKGAKGCDGVAGN